MIAISYKYNKKAELDSTFLLFSVFTAISVPELACNIDCGNYYNHQWSNHEFQDVTVTVQLVH